MKTINIRESLIEFDKQTDFKYSLTDLYEACRLDDKKKNQLVQYIDGKDVDGMSKMLSNEAGVMAENVSDDIADEDLPEDIQVESYLYFDDDYLSDAIDSTMHSGRLLQARWTNNHIVTYLRNDKYEVKHKVNGARVNVEFDTSDKTDSTLKFTVDGKSFVARYPNEAQDIIIRELENKNLKQFDVVVEGLKAGDTVFVKPNKKLGKVKSVKGDYVEVEVMGGHDPDRIDTYYTSDLELQDDVDENLLMEGPLAVLGDLAGKGVGDAWKGVKNFAKGVKDTAKDVAKTTKAVAKSAHNDWKQSKTRAKVVDAARAIKNSDTVDQFKQNYNQRQADRKLSDKARSQSYKGKIGKTIGDVQDWKFEVGNKKMNFDQFMKLPVEQRATLIKNKKVKCFDLSGRETSFQDQAKRLSGLKEALLLEYSEYRRILKEATAVMDRPRVSNVHTHRGSLSGIIDAHMDEINDMINANVPAAHIVHSMRAWIDEANLTKANAKYAQNTLMRMAKMRSAEEVGMYLYNIRLKAENDAYGSIDSQFYGKRYKYEDLNEELLRESPEESGIRYDLHDLRLMAKEAYENGDDEFWRHLTDEELKELWKGCQITKGNPFGAAYDDEVYDEMEDRGLFNKNENYRHRLSESIDEEDKPFTHSQVFDELKRETANFSVGEDRGIYAFEKEVKMAEKILKKHYETVKVTERGNDFMVEFSGPKNKKKKVNESKSLTESKGRFELEVWVPGSGGDDDRERFIMASDNLQEIIDKAYKIDLDGDEAFYLRDMKDIYPYDLDQCYDAEELEDAIYNEWHYEPSADMRKQLGKMLLPKNESLLGKRVQETNSYGKPVGKIGKVVSEDPRSKDHYGNYDIEVEYEDGSKGKTRAFYVQPIDEAYVENPREFADTEHPKRITHWTQAYSEFEKAIKDIDIYDTEAIEKSVEELYNQHKGEFAWDQAWIRWLEPADSENYSSEDDENKAISKWESEKKRIGGYGVVHEATEMATDKNMKEDFVFGVLTTKEGELAKQLLDQYDDSGVKKLRQTINRKHRELDRYRKYQPWDNTGWQDRRYEIKPYERDLQWLEEYIRVNNLKERIKEFKELHDEDYVDEAIEMTADEMKAKHGTDNPDIINAGEEEKDRVALKESSQGKMKCIYDSLNVSDFTDNDKIVFTDNGAYDLEKQGISGIYLWVGYQHSRSGRTNQKLGDEALDVAYDVKKYLEKTYGNKATVENRLSTTDMCRVWIADAGKPEEARVALKEAKTGQEYKGYIICYGCHETDRWYIKNSNDEFVGTKSGYSTEPEAREAIDAMNESLTEAMIYTDTDGFLGEPGEKYTMSQFRRMWQDRDNDPVMSGYDSFEKWVGETISQMDAKEEGDFAPSGRGVASCKIWKDTNGIMGTPGEEYTLNDLADYWTNNNGSDPSLAEYKGDWKAWLDATIPQMEERIDDCLYNEAFNKPDTKGPFWYLCRHGIGPGAIPKGVNILDTVDDEENSSRVYVALDKVLTTDELKQFEMTEQKPPMKESYEIKNVNGHFEIHKDDKFVCSADSQKEAEEEIAELEGK